MPKSLEADILLTNCAWECMALYSKSAEIDVRHLELALKYCGDIGNALIKQGILTMIWQHFVSKRVAMLTDLIDKVKLITTYAIINICYSKSVEPGNLYIYWIISKFV